MNNNFQFDIGTFNIILIIITNDYVKLGVQLNCNWAKSGIYIFFENDYMWGVGTLLSI